MMQARQTLFRHVYEDLREQIVTGRLAYGSKLPSMGQLCELYHVGIRTIRDVLSRLREEEYILTKERRRAVVTYRNSDPDNFALAARSVLGRRTSIREAFQSMAAVIPPLIAFSSRLCGREERLRWQSQLSQIRRKSPKQREQTWTRVFYGILGCSGNLLFGDLLASFERCACMSFFRGKPRFLELVAGLYPCVDAPWDALASGREKEILREFRQMLEAAAASAGRYLEELAQEFGPVQESESPPFQWRPNLGRDQYYTQIARELIDKIGTGVYSEGSFLPKEAALAEEYGVCVSTIRKSLSILNELGFGRTSNGKGTQVLLQNDMEAAQCMKNRIYRRDTLLYLSGLQLMALLLRTAVGMAFPHIGIQEKLSLKERIKEAGVIPLDAVLQCVIACQPLPPMRVILQETGKLLHWGYYFAFFEDGPAGAVQLKRRSLAVYSHLLRGEKERLAEEMSGCYCYMLEFVRDSLSENGLPEAACLIVP